MAAAKKVPAPPALTEPEVEDVRKRLGNGEKPRVVVRAASASVPAGTRGNVVRLTDPKDGEYVVVRLGRDEVPFAPSELALPTRGRPPTTPKPAKATKAAKAAAAPPTPPAVAAAVPPTTRSARRAKVTVPPVERAKPRPAPDATTEPARPRSRRRATKPPAPLTLTLRFDGGNWTVDAQRGNRRLTKGTPVRPGAVGAFAELVEDAQLRDAVTETVESCRAVVAERASRLRAELEAAEAALRDYDARRR